MYKKVLSAILFGALTIASTSTIVSCKDYDDDIKSLETRIDANDTNEAALKTALTASETKVADLKAQLEAEDARLKELIASLQTASSDNKTNIQSEILRATGREAALEARIQTAEEAIAELKTLIADLKNNKVDKTEFNTKVQDIYAKIEAVETNLGSALTQIAALQQGLQNEETARKAAIADLQQQINALNAYTAKVQTLETSIGDVQTSLNTSVTDLNTQLGQEAQKLQNTNSSVEELKQQVTNIFNQVTEINEYISNVSVINVLVDEQLKSLVFEPESYYEGIQAFDIPTFDFKPITLAAASPNVKEAHNPQVATSLFSFTGDMSATYHLNPSTANVSEEADRYKFIGYDMDYTRARTNTSSKFTIKKAEVKNGKVTVKAVYNDFTPKDIKTQEKVSVVALQYSMKGAVGAKDTTITSDYAAIRANRYTDIALNLTTKAKGINAGVHNSKRSSDPYAIPTHMYLTADAAIAADAQIEVVWNSEGIDLREYVQACRSYNAHMTTQDFIDKNWDDNAKAGVVEQDGFKYSFELVGYTTGSNNTKQSTHAIIRPEVGYDADGKALDANSKYGYWLRPQMPAANGDQAAWVEMTDENQAEVQNIAEAGREPLVRVALTDTVHNKVAAVGYVKVKILPTEPEEKEENADYIEITTQTWPYTIACDDNAFQTLQLKWYDIEHQILAKLNMQKSYFEDMYQLDGATADNVAATQYNGVKVNSSAVSTPFGKVYYDVSTDGDATDTKVLKWQIKNQEAYTAQKGGTPVAKTAIVRFSPKSTAPETPDPKFFYVVFTWKPSAVNIKPETSFGDKNKLASYWYKTNHHDNTVDEGKGFDEIHGNVETVGTDVAIKDPATLDKASNYADDEFVIDVRNTLDGHKLSLDNLVAPYAALNGDMKNTFVFVDGNGLTAYAGGTQLMKGTALVATIDPATGVIRYEKSATALELLNAADHTDMANSVTATVNVKSVACSGSTTGVSNIPVTVKNNSFNVKFLRPIDLTEGTARFEDAATGGDDADIELSFIDWRNHKFIGDSRTRGFDYFTYYGISKIDVKVAQAKTNLKDGKTFQSLKSVAPNFQLTYTEPTYYPAATYPDGHSRTGNFVRAGQYGTLHYDNNGSTMGGAIVKIPVEVTYDWGVIKDVEIVCTFDKTTGNVKKH